MKFCLLSAFWGRLCGAASDVLANVPLCGSASAQRALTVAKGRSTKPNRSLAQATLFGVPTTLEEGRTERGIGQCQPAGCGGSRTVMVVNRRH